MDGEDIILADEPSAFAKAVADLLKDECRRQSLVWAARRRVEEQYSLPVLRSAVRRALEELERKLGAVEHE